MNTVAIQFLAAECELQLRIESIALSFGDLQVAQSALFAAGELADAAFRLAVTS